MSLWGIITLTLPELLTTMQRPYLKRKPLKPQLHSLTGIVGKAYFFLVDVW